MSTYHARSLENHFGGEPAIELKRTESSPLKEAYIQSAIILPGRGMNIFQLTANIPGRGEVEMFASPSLEEAQTILRDDYVGSKSYSLGGAILFPYANRVRGNPTPDGPNGAREIEVEIAGKNYRLPANHQGKEPGAEAHAMHGLILDQKFVSTVNESSTKSGVSGKLDFKTPHWPSEGKLQITGEIKEDGFLLRVLAQNTGTEKMPVGFGWHPYFKILSGLREQAILKMPSSNRLLVDNYDNVFPTGRVQSNHGSEYGFSGKGKALGQTYLDDSFIDFKRELHGELIVEMIDPASDYGVRITSSSPAVQAVQIYSPVDRAFVGIEPQTNRADPFNPMWKGKGGMLFLNRGESTEYSVHVQVFAP